MLKKLITIFLTVSFIFTVTGCRMGDSDGSYSSPTASVTPNDSGAPLFDDIFTDGNSGQTPDTFDDSKFFSTRRFKKDTNTYKSVTVSPTDYNGFVKYVDQINTPYSYSEYYRLEDALGKYEALPDLKATKHDRLLENITVSELLKRVKSNNKVYKKEKEKDYTAVFYEELSESDLKKHCTTIVNTVNHYINAGKVDDINELKCILGDLKIFEKSVMSNAYVSDDNCLIISPIAETMDIMTLGQDQDNMVATVAHETCHMLQKGCSHNNELVYAIGHSYKFDDMSIHPLYNNWFYEGAAEKLMVNATGFVPIVYKYYISYINSMNLSVVLKEGRGIYDTEETSLYNSLNPLFDAFFCKTEEEKNELLNLLFSMEIVETDDPEFKAVYDPDITEEELVDLKRELKNSVCETLTKYFYKSLAELATKNALPLNDIFYLITVFEHDLNSHIVFTNSEKREAAKDFISTYVDIQNRFFEMLAEGGDYSTPEITELFCGYGLITASEEKNFNLSALSKEKQFVFAKTLTETYIVDFVNIRTE